MWQTIIVIVIVTVSAVYATWLLLPLAVRARLAAWLAARLPQRGGPFRWLRSRLEQRARPTAPPTGCDACPQFRIEPVAGRKPPAMR